MSNVIINIPHSSTLLPDEFYERILISKEKLEKENILLTDLYVNELIDKSFNILKAKYSRLYCDVERFSNDNDEIMSEKGMGVIYSKTLNGEDLIRLDADYKSKVLETYYNSYHKKFYQLTNNILDNYDKVIIIDLHSYSDLLLEKLNMNFSETPDICIGYNAEFVDMEILNKIKSSFLENGYSLSENYPYSGSIVPYEYYKNNNHKVISIMIEINKRIYLDDNVKFKKLSYVLNEIIKNIQS